MAHSHRWGGGPGRIGNSDDPKTATNSLNLWSIDPDALLAGSTEWRFDGTVAERYYASTSGGKDGLHPGGSVVDTRRNQQHVFVYCGTRSPTPNPKPNGPGGPGGTSIYRISRTLDTHLWRAACGLITDPGILRFSPVGFKRGDTVVITGVNFSGATTVDFSGAATNIFSVNADGTGITVVAPDTLTTGGRITISGPQGSGTSADAYTVPLPSVTGFSGAVDNACIAPGATVEITGAGFFDVQEVLFNGAAAAFHGAHRLSGDARRGGGGKSRAFVFLGN